MTFETVVNPLQPLWPALSAKWQKPSNTLAPMASLDQANQDEDPDPPPAAPPARQWPRIFPDL
jgi:hypothetical protein